MSERQRVNGRLHPLVRPRRETEKWRHLGRLLDTINDANDEAIHRGFVNGKTRRLDAALTQIITAATEAKSLLRSNAELNRPEADRPEGRP